MQLALSSASSSPYPLFWEVGTRKGKGFFEVTKLMTAKPHLEPDVLVQPHTSGAQLQVGALTTLPHLHLQRQLPSLSLTQDHLGA